MIQDKNNSLWGGDYVHSLIAKCRGDCQEVQVQFQPNEKVQHVNPYFDKQGRHVANNFGSKALRRILSVGSLEGSNAFWSQLWPPGSAKALTLVEGECDALAASECRKCFPTVSVKNGASGAVRDCVDNFEYLNFSETIVICFDKDEPR